jgi:hypothetical protein
MAIHIPYKQMFNWSAGNLGLSLLGVWYMLLAFMSPKTYGVPSVIYSPNQGLLLFGLMFFAISLVNSVPRPTVLGAVFTMLIGLSYFMGWIVTSISPVILWTLSIVLFLGVLVEEFGIFKIGPSDSKAKILTIVPLAIIGFSLVLALFGYNPLVKFNWNYTLSAVNLLAVTVLCWLYVLDYAGWRPFKGKTNMWLNVIAIGAVALSVIGMYQGALFAW